MHKTPAEALDLVDALKAELSDVVDVEVVVCPTFTALYPVQEAIRGTRIELGAQDVYWEEEGAFTGEISPGMLSAVGCRYVIIGHSERRGYFHETDEDVNRKAKALLGHGLRPIICVGESLEQREAGKTEEVVTRQVKAAFSGLSVDRVPECVIAYEPIWAIGTGRASNGEDANKVARLIRNTLAEIFNKDVAEAVRIQYGGSVKAANIAEFIRQPEIDGALVGGASLKADEFAKIVKA